ncbi:hypothetical protein [Pseudooceanicola sp.]|uniref:hypothetical protein n=1 Tax=Pseudooceanicola sp. TaxID=1914328 RepID=UPI004059F3DB
MLRTLPTKTLSAELHIAIVRTFFTEHGTALCNAAGLIAGEAGTARVLRLMSMLREAPLLDRTMRLRLVDLHRLLSLDPAIEAYEPDFSTWVFLDPASEEVENLCLLTDRLYDLLIDICDLDAEWVRQALDLPAQKAA